jgi:hypothetical protein
MTTDKINDLRNETKEAAAMLDKINKFIGLMNTPKLDINQSDLLRRTIAELLGVVSRQLGKAGESFEKAE